MHIIIGLQYFTLFLLYRAFWFKQNLKPLAHSCCKFVTMCCKFATTICRKLVCERVFRMQISFWQTVCCKLVANSSDSFPAQCAAKVRHMSGTQRSVTTITSMTFDTDFFPRPHLFFKYNQQISSCSCYYLIFL